MTEKPSAEKSPFTGAPTICPLLSMGTEGTDCFKEGCWLYNRAMKKCVLVHMAISMARIADALSKGDFDMKMESLKRQHGPE